MCSVKQWKAYQAAEAMVSAEVDEVRAEADEVEPGWSQVRPELVTKPVRHISTCMHTHDNWN